MGRVVSAVSRWPRLALAVMVAVSLPVAAGTTKLSFDSSVASLTEPDNRARKIHEQAVAMFGDEEIGVAVIVVDDVYRPAVIDELSELTEALAKVEGVDRTLSLANVTDPTVDVFDPPRVVPRRALRDSEMAELRVRVEANPLFVPNLVSADGKTAAVNVFFGAGGISAEDEARVDAEIADILKSYDGPGEIFYTGMSHIRVRAIGLMRADLLRFLPVTLLCMVIVLWLAFRSFRAVLLPLASQALSVSILLGVMGWIGAPITLPTLVLPSLLLVIGASYAIHVTSALLETGTSADAEDTFTHALGRVGLPVAVSCLTTGVGFGSLALHPIPAISGLGVYALVGIVIAATGCLFAMPVAFLSLPGREREALSGQASDPSTYSRSLDGVVNRVGAFTIDHRRSVFFVSFILLLVSLIGATKIKVDTDFLKAFRKGSDVRVAHDAVTDNLVGPNPISIVITGPEKDYFKSIAPLRRVRVLQEFLAGLETVGASISLVDYLEQLDAGLRASSDGLSVDEAGNLIETGPPPSFWDDPEKQLPAVLQFVSLSPRTFAGLVDKDFQRLNVTVRTSVSGSRETAELVDTVTNYAETMFPRGVEVTPTGSLVVVSEVADLVIGGQIESVGTALSVIFLILSLMFLSLRVGLAAMIPNVLPVVVFFGVMGWCGVELNLATSIIAAVALGIAVDDTIHYMARLNKLVKSSESQREALLSTLSAVGRPVVTTSLTLTAGFLVMALSSFKPINMFGALSAMTMMVALATNLILLPALLATVPVISVWDLVSSRLGARPHRTIPLFQGLGRLAVRLIVLLGNLKSFEEGSAIVKRGEPGNEMYLVLNGEADVSVPSGGATRSLARLERGDVFGEMALLRRAVRTADVTALTPVEVLVIDEDFLRRLRQRYPRFAAAFFVNIARILSDRLEEANRRAEKAN